MRCNKFHILVPAIILTVLFTCTAAHAQYRHKTLLKDRYIHQPVNKQDCTVCHELHFPEADGQISNSVPGLCYECHKNPARGKKIVHSPMIKGKKCLSCHYPHSAPVKSLLRAKTSRLCIGCHTDKKNGVHGKSRFTGDCQLCHDPHASDSSGLLKAIFIGQCSACHKKLDKDVFRHSALDEYECQECHNPHMSPPEPTLSCNECHDEKTSGANVHPPVEDGCGSCHEPHSGPYEYQLQKMLPDLCLECHDEMDSGRHGEVFLGDKCNECHDPHSSPRPGLLTIALEKAACESCHQAQRAGEVVHSPILELECNECHDPHSTPPAPTVACLDCHESLLQNKYRHEVAGEDCSNCHDTHSGSLPKLLTARIPDICLDCHDQEDGRHGSTMLGTSCGECHDPHSASRKKLLKSLGDRSCTDCHTEIAHSKYLHSALSKFQCQHCHDPHAEPPGTPPMECKDCHLNVADNSIAHGRRSNGRCLECHDPHGSISPDLLKEEQVQFTEDCLGCHRDIRRNIDTGRHLHEPLTAGDCFGCHTAHKGDLPFTVERFDVRKNVPYDPEAYALCFQCHLPALVQERFTETDTGFRHKNRNLHNLHVVRDSERGFSCWVCHDPHSSGQPHLLSQETPVNSAYSLKIEYRKTQDGGQCTTNCHIVQEYKR